jgi:hypothetical protein
MPHGFAGWRGRRSAAQGRRLLALAEIYDGGLAHEGGLRRRGRFADNPGLGAQVQRFQKAFPERLDAIARDKGNRLEVWFADEARIGQKNKITRRWALRGTRPSAPHYIRGHRAVSAAATFPRGKQRSNRTMVP